MTLKQHGAAEVVQLDAVQVVLLTCFLEHPDPQVPDLGLRVIDGAPHAVLGPLLRGAEKIVRVVLLERGEEKRVETCRQ